MNRTEWILPILRIVYKLWPLVVRLTRLPLIGKVAYDTFFKTDHLVYLPRDKVIEINRSLEPSSMVLPSEVVEYFIEKANHH